MGDGGADGKGAGVAGPMQWSDEEDAALAEHYPAHGGDWDGWETVLPGRTTVAIKTRASIVGVRMEGSPARWTEAEDETLTDLYPDHGAAWDGWAECLPCRTAGAIRFRAHALGVRRRHGAKGRQGEGALEAGVEGRSHDDRGRGKGHGEQGDEQG